MAIEASEYLMLFPKVYTYKYVSKQKFGAWQNIQDEQIEDDDSEQSQFAIMDQNMKVIEYDQMIE